MSFMSFSSFRNKIAQFYQTLTIVYITKWFLISLVIGGFAGLFSATLLLSLEWATSYRENHFWIIALLPIAGLVIGLSYHYWGSDVVKGNNQLLEEFHKPSRIIPFKMAPMIFFGTVLTHLFGGSAGREGTAVQMGGAIADQFTKWLKIESLDRRILLIMGISAGFSSVFGTPLAGTIFALEVFTIGRMQYALLIPSLFAALIAYYTCQLLGVGHTVYQIDLTPELGLNNILWAVLAGLLFGITAILFSKSTHTWNSLSNKLFRYPPIRPLVGGAILAVVIFLTGSTRYIGLGLPVISESFVQHALPYDFLLKMLFTSFTLGLGFKGGEVTPLFFIGATLGNTLSLFIPLPMALLAGMGFVAVFSGATNTPIACTIMGIELFGVPCGIFVAIACFMAYLASGHTGIYGSQLIGSTKKIYGPTDEGRTLNQLKE
jgi:H+/Cl- antiporter ClcA